MQEIKYTPVENLKVHPQNPRLIKDEQFKVLCESIRANRDYFETRPILANKDGVIFAGNMRYLAAKEIGMTEVPAVMMDISEERQREIMIRDNISNGQYDWNILANNFDFDELVGWGFDKVELQRGFDLGFSPDEKDDQVPEVASTPPIVQPADVWILGRHRLMCGDSTVAADIEKLMAGQKADMVFTDPPYNIDYKGGMHADGSQSKRRKILNDKMSSENFYRFLFAVCQNLLQVTSGAFYICMSSGELHNLWKAFTDAGGHWQEYIIWAKQSFTLSRTDYQQQFEPIMYGLNETVAKSIEDKYEESDGEAILYGWSKHEWYGGRKQGNVWHFDRPTASKEHPTMKPVMLCAKAIANSCKINGLVLDAFLGSGSTLIATEKLGRICYGLELDPHYCDVILQRYVDFTHQDPVRKSDGKRWSELKEFNP